LDSGYEEQVDWVQWVSPTHSWNSEWHQELV
jgi:hypothetical protein